MVNHNIPEDQSDVVQPKKLVMVCGVICENEMQFQRMAHIIRSTNREFDVRPILISSAEDWANANRPRLYLPNDYHIDFERVGKLTDEIAATKNVCSGDLLLESRIIKDPVPLSDRIKLVRKRMVREKFEGIGT